MNKDFSYIDLFAGCGGLSLGLYNAGWKGLFAIEKSADAFKTLKHNLIDKREHFSWVDWLPQENLDIKDVIEKYKKNLKLLRNSVDMVTGGPPCQGFSMAGRRNENDQRNELVEYYIQFIKLVRPRIIFFENVKGFTLEFKKNRDKGKLYSKRVTDGLAKAGYSIHGELIDFGEFGIPQKRTRFILVGIRKDICKSGKDVAKQFFEKIRENRERFLINKNLSINTNLEDAISDLLQKHGTIASPDTNNFQAGVYSTPDSPYQVLMRQGIEQYFADSHRFVNHSTLITERFQFILNNARRNKGIDKDIRNKLDLKKHRIVALDKKDKSPTLTTLPDDYIHYSEPRILTVREYARIQSFPDSFEFKGKYTTGAHRRKTEVPRYTQVGNAIPPLFGEQSGVALKDLL
jgi:DNA (cytosine-5)-methyltransferase 1